MSKSFYEMTFPQNVTREMWRIGQFNLANISAGFIQDRRLRGFNSAMSQEFGWRLAMVTSPNLNYKVRLGQDKTHADATGCFINIGL